MSDLTLAQTQATFVKMKFPKGEVTWFLLIDNHDEIAAYIDKENDLDIQAYYMSMNMHDPAYVPTTDREKRLYRVMNMEAQVAPEGTKVWPQNVITSYVIQRYNALAKNLRILGTLAINQAGGFCNYDHFLNVGGVVVEKVVKNDFYHPTNKDVSKGDVLFLENSPQTDAEFVKTISTIIDNYDGLAVTELLNVVQEDPEWVVKTIVQHKTICIYTNLISDKQLETYIQLFCSIPAKTIYLSGNLDSILNHPKWDDVRAVHTIKII